MVGWYRVTFTSSGWEENKDIICKTIKPVVEKLDKTGDIINFFFLEYYGPGEDPRVKFWFYGDKDIVTENIEETRDNDTYQLEDFDPTSQAYRFADDYSLGIKLFEIGSRLALCSIGNRNPLDTTATPPAPIILVLRHSFLQNLGYIGPEESARLPPFDRYLNRFFKLVKQTKIK